jgi:hypothetical protein
MRVISVRNQRDIESIIASGGKFRMHDTVRVEVLFPGEREHATVREEDLISEDKVLKVLHGQSLLCHLDDPNTDEHNFWIRPEEQKPRAMPRSRNNS